MTDITAFLPEPSAIRVANEKSKVFARVGGIDFATQRELAQHAQAMLRRHADGEIANTADAFFLLQLLARHEIAAEKIGAGVFSFQKRINLYLGTNPTPGWCAIRVDGSEVLFSIYDCLRDSPRTIAEKRLAWIKISCRTAVSAMMADIKAAAFSSGKPVSCPATGTLLCWIDASVDHAGDWTFSRIVDEWLHSIRDWFWTIEIAPGAGNTSYMFADIKLAEHFISFHNERAQLRIVHRQYNMSRGSAGFKTTFVPPGEAALDV